MSSTTDANRPTKRAETEFREAFERLKRNRPERLPKGTPVSQNNVAKEAGCDPSALRKSRYPSLIAEIQRWLEEHAPEKPQSRRQNVLAQRERNRSMRVKLDSLKIQRDQALSLLVEADAKIFELTIDNARLQALQPASNVTKMRSKPKD